ncbi:MAG: helix-turn-helix domain-containing protein [Methylocapsa sp.]|nr:helix-turn-helix domain-containing protein [Methylocapsa sp.]
MATNRDRAELEARRLQGARLLRQGVKPAEVARRLKVSRTSVWCWEQALDANGQRALRKAAQWYNLPPRFGPDTCVGNWSAIDIENIGLFSCHTIFNKSCSDPCIAGPRRRLTSGNIFALHRFQFTRWC